MQYRNKDVYRGKVFSHRFLWNDEKIYSDRGSKINFSQFAKFKTIKFLGNTCELTPIKVSDINKHQYVSCVVAFDGPISAGATAAAGLYKEGADLYKKWNNPQYGSNWQILQDSFKDLKNDALGISGGWSANNIDDCNYLLPPNARRR